MEPFLARRVRQPVGRPPGGRARPRPRSRRPGRRSPGCSGPRRPRWCSPPAAPRPTTSRSRARPGPPGRAGLGDGVGHRPRSSTRACWPRATASTAEGFRVARVGAGRRRGRRPRRDRGARSTTAPSLVSVMLVNNEVGTVQPLDEVVARGAGARAPCARAHRRGAGGAVARRRPRPPPAPTSWRSPRTSSVGPKGVGALVVRGGVAARAAASKAVGRSAASARARRTSRARSRWPPALRATRDARDADVARIGALRDRLVDGPARAIPDAFENGDRAAKVAGNAHVGFRGVEAEALLRRCSTTTGVCAAAGSSCSSGATEPSHVLAAMGVDTRRRARRRSGSASGSRRPTPTSTPRLEVVPARSRSSARRRRRRVMRAARRSSP